MRSANSTTICSSSRDAPSGGKIVASAGELTAEARIAVLPPPTYSEDFEGFAADASPIWVGTGSKFKVREMEGNKVLVKPPAARGLHRANTYLGAPDMAGYTIQADLLGTKKRRAVPDMGLIANRYNPRHDGLPPAVADPHLGRRVADGQNRALRLENRRLVHHEDAGGNRRRYRPISAAKSGPATSRSPARWSIQAIDPLPNRSGSPGIYGYSPAEIYYDNLKVW